MNCDKLNKNDVIRGTVLLSSISKRYVHVALYSTTFLHASTLCFKNIVFIIILLTCLAVLCFYSKTGFWPSYCQISTDLDKILYTPIFVRNTLMG